MVLFVGYYKTMSLQAILGVRVSRASVNACKCGCDGGVYVSVSESASMSEGLQVWVRVSERVSACECI